MGLESISQYIVSYGPFVAYILLFGIIFAESGLLIGFFLPGDSLLFTAGFLASKGILNIYILVPLCFIAAVIGDSVGYSFGKRVGRKLFNREDSLLFHKDNLLKAEAFYKKHGGKTIIIARFLPLIRTFAPIIAGMADMDYKSFLMFNIVGGALWAIGLTVAGFFLGNLVPDIDKYLLPIIGGIVFISVAPTAFHILKDAENRKKVKATIRSIIKRKRS